ncbi:MAG: CvpA family protein [Chloroflexaceae bacterium]|nr:CvpA family protein [Chloroflexaceae bacterium]
MNLIDLFFLVCFVAMVGVGFFQGMVKLMVLVVAFYLSMVLSSLYFSTVGSFMVRNFRAERFVGEYIGFFLVLMLSFILLTLAGLYTFRYVTLPGRLQYLDRIGGMLIGTFLGAFMLGIFGVLLWNLMIVRGGQNIDLPLFRMLGRGVGSSGLLSYFANVILPQVYGLLNPILPGEADILFLVR